MGPRRTPTDLLAQAQCSGKVPTVAGLLGPSAGHGALVAPVCDFTIMSRQGAIGFPEHQPDMDSRRVLQFSPRPFSMLPHHTIDVKYIDINITLR